MNRITDDLTDLPGGAAKHPVRHVVNHKVGTFPTATWQQQRRQKQKQNFRLLLKTGKNFHSRNNARLARGPRKEIIKMFAGIPSVGTYCVSSGRLLVVSRTTTISSRWWSFGVVDIGLLCWFRLAIIPDRTSTAEQGENTWNGKKF